MRLTKILSLLPLLAVLFVASAPADAQSTFGIGFSKFGRHSGVSLGFSTVIQPRRCWVPGHYETRCTEVFVPGCIRQVWVEPVYDTCVDPCGNGTRVLIRAGYFRTIQEPGRYETRYVQVWVPGYYA